MVIPSWILLFLEEELEATKVAALSNASLMELRFSYKFGMTAAGSQAQVPITFGERLVLDLQTDSY
jgi:hypothetical protein